MYGLVDYDASTLIEEDGAAAFFERTVAAAPQHAKKLANWLTSSVFGHLNEHKTDMRSLTLTPAQLLSVVELIEAGKINGM